MECKIVGMIDAEIRKLPPRGNKRGRDLQYESAKQHLFAMFPDIYVHEYICKEIAKKYGI